MLRASVSTQRRYLLMFTYSVAARRWRYLWLGLCSE